MLEKQHFVAIKSCISGEVGGRFQSKICTIPLDNYPEVAVSSITKCLNTSTICRKVARCDK